MSEPLKPTSIEKVDDYWHIQFDNAPACTVSAEDADTEAEAIKVANQQLAEASKQRKDQA